MLRSIRLARSSSLRPCAMSCVWRRATSFVGIRGRTRDASPRALRIALAEGTWCLGIPRQQETLCGGDRSSPAGPAGTARLRPKWTTPMKVFLDTSVLVAAFYGEHQHHAPGFALFVRQKKATAAVHAVAFFGLRVVRAPEEGNGMHGGALPGGSLFRANRDAR